MDEDEAVTNNEMCNYANIARYHWTMHTILIYILVYVVYIILVLFLQQKIFYLHVICAVQ